MPTTSTRSRGLTLLDTVAAVAALALLGACLISAAAESRRQSSLGDNIANLKQFGAATGAYAHDFGDAVWGFSWRAGVDYGFGGVAGSDLQAAANQAIWILARRTGRPAWFTVPTAWFPHGQYSHLPLLDYLDAPAPMRAAAAPEDALRLLWQSDPFEGFETLPPHMRPTEPNQRHVPFSSSYHLNPAFYARDAAQSDPPGTTLSQAVGSAHYQWIPGTLPMGGRRLDEVALPAHKIMFHELFQRHFGPRIAFYAHAEARAPVLTTDGAAAVHRAADTNRGFIPNNPTSANPTRIAYTPRLWEPPTLTGTDSELVIAGHRFTRSGLRGRDFGGPEVPWQD